MCMEIRFFYYPLSDFLLCFAKSSTESMSQMDMNDGRRLEYSIVQQLGGKWGEIKYLASVAGIKRIWSFLYLFKRR